MNIKKLFFSLMAFVCIALVGGCSDEDAPNENIDQNVIDTEYINSLMQDGVLDCFCFRDQTFELLSDQTPNRYNIPFDSVGYKGLPTDIYREYTNSVYFRACLKTNVKA